MALTDTPRTDALTAERVEEIRDREDISRVAWYEVKALCDRVLELEKALEDALRLADVPERNQGDEWEAEYARLQGVAARKALEP